MFLILLLVIAGIVSAIYFKITYNKVKHPLGDIILITWTIKGVVHKFEIKL